MVDKMTQEELKMALELHKKWLSNESDGVRLDLSGTDFYGLDLRGMDLSYADLSGMDLSYEDLSRTNLQGADLSYADLSGTKLYYANLHSTNLSRANTINVIGIDVICVQLNTSDKNRQIQYYVQLKKATAGCFSGTLDELKKAVDEKHGVEIFEWDILTSQDGTDGLISRFIVKRDEFYTGFIPMNREGYGFNRTMCEVIGNVHQQPELLEV